MERYGLSSIDYESMYEAQGGGCAICGREDSGVVNRQLLCVDHDHDTGEVRGLLCDSCNNGLGRFKDSPELLMSALQYLQRHSKGKQ